MFRSIYDILEKVNQNKALGIFMRIGRNRLVLYL